MRIERLRQEFSLDVRWVAFPLYPDIPREGILVEKLFPPGMYDFRMASARLERFAREEGIAFNPGEGMAYNSTRAQALSKLAEQEGRGDAYHAAAFRAMFVDRVNIADTEVLMKIAEAAGLDPSVVESALSESRYTDAVNSDWEECRRRGVTAVPNFRFEGRSVSGAQPYEELQRLITGPGTDTPGGLNVL